MAEQNIISMGNAPLNKMKYAKIVTIIGLCINLILASLKVTVSIISNNLSLLADGLDSGLDLASTMLGFFAIRIADRPADKDHHFGHGKIENLFSVGIALLLVASSGIIGFQAVDKLIKHTLPEFLIYNVIVASSSIVLKAVLVFINIRIGKKIKSPTLIANGLNFRTDILTSGVVLVSVIIAPLTVNGFDLYWVDSIIALMISVVIIFTAIKITKEAAKVLLDESPNQEMVDSIAKIAKNQEGVKDITNIRARAIGAENILVDLIVLLNPKITIEEGHNIVCQLEKVIMEQLPVKYLQIHMEPYHSNEPEQCDPKVSENE
ncbi:MAG TPA: cation diffusion facilitator family transporter [Candidatus Bathyarchaeia archaeon]|nr:cation diffusion facilitator family transporter [Candidatus Bathyarchaeia archaeon]